MGLLSGLIGSAGPLGAAIFLSLRLNPVAYVASGATAARVIYGMKMVVYPIYLEVDRRFWWLGVTLSVGMVLGTCLSPEKFRDYVAFVLVSISLYMLLWG